MRIRKQASKLLGWVYNSSFPSSTSPPPPAAHYYCPPPPPSEAGAGELQCQLNLSPWDSIESTHCTKPQEELKSTNDDDDEEEEDEEEGMVVVKNVLKAKEEEEGKVEEKTKDIKEEKKDEKERARKRKEEKEREASGSGMIKCKKTDGKGWHCKRAAQFPHSLCSYHLTQLRSYRARFEDRVSGNKNSAAAVDAASNYYYYYSILGPWWGKRRGPVDGHEAGNEDNGRSETNEDSEISPHYCNGKIDHHKKALADDDDDDDDGGESRCNVSYKKKKRPVKKRGRKPVKARSLKSLL